MVTSSPFFIHLILVFPFFILYLSSPLLSSCCLIHLSFHLWFNSVVCWTIFCPLLYKVISFGCCTSLSRYFHLPHSPSLPPSLLYHSASLSLSCLIFTGLLRWVHVIEITGVHMRWKHTHFPHLDYTRITQDNASFLLLITLSKGWSDGSSAWQF